MLIFSALACFGFTNLNAQSSYTSSRNGNFLIQSNWKATQIDQNKPRWNQSCGITGENLFEVSHNMTLDCQLAEFYGKSQVVIRKGATLTCFGNISMYGDSKLVIEENAKLIVQGDVSFSGNSEVTLNGEVRAIGDLICTGNASACGNGQVELAGTMSGNGWCSNISILPFSAIGVSARLNKNQQVVLSWSSQNSPVNSYDIERSSNGMSFNKVSTLLKPNTTNAFTFTDKILSAQTYYYRVSSKTKGGNIQTSEIVAVSIFDSDETDLCELEVIPNPCVPSCEARIIDCPNGNFKTQILDGNGNIIQVLIPYYDSNSLIKYHIDPDNFLLPGTYIINSENDKARLSKKMIIK